VVDDGVSRAISQSNDEYILQHNNASLEVKSPSSDRAEVKTLKCLAKNSAGYSHDIATVVFERDDEISSYFAADVRSTELVVVFHQNGYTVYETTRCHVDHQVDGAFQLNSPGGAALCASRRGCEWGRAVRVRDRYVYVAQPTLDRVVVIETTDRLNPVEVISTDRRPTSIHYVDHLDQVWVRCDEGVAMVVRDASDETTHSAVHVQPIFDDDEDRRLQIDGLFLPGVNSLQYSVDIGYVAGGSSMMLHKIDLLSLKYIKSVNLTSYSCLPVDAVFLPIGGRLAVSCSGDRILILDYVTDRVLDVLKSGGDLFVSPDMRNLVMLSADENTVSVYSIADDGTMAHAYDEHTQLKLGRRSSRRRPVTATRCSRRHRSTTPSHRSTSTPGSCSSSKVSRQQPASLSPPRVTSSPCRTIPSRCSTDYVITSTANGRT
jgi:hypothetical protein